MSRRSPVVQHGPAALLYRSLAGIREALAVRRGHLVLLAGLACAGCSTARLVDDDQLVTGSVRATPVAARIPEGGAPRGVAPGDWDEAKLALDQALASSDKDISVPWENRQTGTSGTATPIGAARPGGCRDFLIAVVDGKSADRWVQGEVCRSRAGTVLSQVRVLGQA